MLKAGFKLATQLRPSLTALHASPSQVTECRHAPHIPAVDSELNDWVRNVAECLQKIYGACIQPPQKKFVFLKIVFYYLVFRLIHLFLAQYINIKQGILVYECTPGALGVQIGNLSRAAVVAHLFNPTAQEAESFAL